MKKVIANTLLAIGVMALSGSALAESVTLVTDGLHSGSGSTYSNVNGGRTVVSTGTWDWDAGTGVLTLTGNHQAHWTVGPTGLLDDVITGGMVINTGAGTTTAGTYDCIEGPFGGGTGANSCENVAYGLDFFNETSVTYNVGADANCIVRGAPGGTNTIAGPVRGPDTHVGKTGCDDQNGAYADYNIVQALGPGNALILSNNAAAPTSCYTSTAKNAACANVTWLTFVPVPAAAWLFGPALGLLGLARRRTA